MQISIEAGENKFIVNEFNLINMSFNENMDDAGFITLFLRIILPIAYQVRYTLQINFKHNLFKFIYLLQLVIEQNIIK